jgi:hypothetical protein
MCESDREIGEQRVQFVFASPESMLKNEGWRSTLLASTCYKVQVTSTEVDQLFIVVDEELTVIHW